jgi:hypothetical protein
MKNLNSKILITLYIIFVFSFNGQLLFSQDIGYGELLIVNHTSDGVARAMKVRIYPVGAIFSGGKQYTVEATKKISNDNNKIYGQEFALDYNLNSRDSYARINFDASDDREYCDFSLGYGLYKIEFYNGNPVLSNYGFADSCYIDFSDANFTGISQSNYFQKLRIDFYENQDITFCFYDLNGNTTTPVNINDSRVNKYIKVWEQIGTSNSALTQDKGMFNDTTIAQYHNYPIDATDFGAIAHERPNDIYLNLKMKYQGGNTKSDNILNFNNCEFKISDGITYTINSFSSVTPEMNIIGTGGKLTTGSNSQIVFPLNFVINLTNGAIANCSGSVFQPSSSTLWYGIKMTNPGASTFSSCTFNSAYRTLYLHNSYDEIDVSNCTFNVPYKNNDNAIGINTINSRQLYVNNNTFNLPQVDLYNGAGIFLHLSATEDNNAYNYVIIQNNKFYDGLAHVLSQGLTGNLLSLYSYSNKFGNSSYNLALNFTTLDSKYNSTNNAYSNPLIGNVNNADNSNVNYLGDTINSSVTNFSFNIDTYANMGPLINSETGEVIMLGGYNVVESQNENNILFDNNSFPFTDWGKNQFTKVSSSYHIRGIYVNDTVLMYYTNGNCWYGNNNEPNIKLTHYGSSKDIPYVWEEGANQCDEDVVTIDKIISYKGLGVWDTISVIHRNLNIQISDDQKLYNIGAKAQLLRNYEVAILNFKSLINNYPGSNYLCKSLYNIYECYRGMDTTGNNTLTNTLFNQLKTYLLDKLQEYQSYYEFTGLAYEFVLKCDVKIKNYIESRDGYEFLSLNSPFEIERLTASWNYMLLNEIIQNNNSGGGYGSHKQNLKKSAPVKTILLNSYKQISNKEKNIRNYELTESSTKEKAKEYYNQKDKDKIEVNKLVTYNLQNGNTLSQERIIEKTEKDNLKYLTKNYDDGSSSNNANQISYQYSLFQNYPNPFNPVTNIKYQIQKTGLVTLKIYDVTGREIKALVNEVKSPGSYVVTFNGIELASGVYFYRIQVGDFVQVRKMVLIK